MTKNSANHPYCDGKTIQMDEQVANDLKRFFAALSDEDRLQIAGVLAGREATVLELSELLGMRQPAVAKHLTVLADAGLVESTQRGALVSWSLATQVLREQRKQLLARERSPSPGDQPGRPDWDRAVLANFFDGERLKEIPVNLRRRQVVLSWLAGRFEPDTHYPERDVNQIINRHHPDHATLRRELVDHGYLQRERGVYWRVMAAPEDVSS